MDTHKPAWFDYAKATPRPDDNTSFPERFRRAEHVKSNLLKAQDTALALRERQEALMTAVGDLAELTIDADKTLALFDSVLRSDAIPREVRENHLPTYIIFHADLTPQRLRTYLDNHPLLTENPGLAERMNNVIERMETNTTVSLDPKEAHDRAVTLLEDGTITQVELGRLSMCLKQLYRTGEDELAAQVSARAEASNPDQHLSKIQLKLELGKAKRIGQGEAKLLAILQDTVRNARPGQFDQSRKLLSTSSHSEHIPHGGNPLAETQVRTIALQRSGSAPPDRMFAMLMFAFGPQGSQADQALCRQLFQHAMAEAPDDATRAELFQHSRPGIDMDDPSNRSFVEQVMRPYRDARNHPETAAMIRMVDFDTAIRLGKKVDINQDFDRIDDEEIHRELLRTRLQYFLLHQDKNRLAKLFDETDTDALLKPEIIGHSIRALRLLERSDEAALFAEEARRHLYEGILSRWTTPYTLSAGALEFDLLDVIPDQLNTIPTAYAEMMSRQPRKAFALQYALSMAHLRKDWQAAVKHTGELVKIQPNHYDIYWLGGHAAAKSGETATAVRWLQTYVKYSKNTLEYPGAVELLKSLKASAPAGIRE